MEAYPMPMFAKLTVQDVKKSIEWYKNVLHFTAVFELTDDDGNVVMAHIRGKKYQDLMLVLGDTQGAFQEERVILQFAADDVDVYVKNAGADIIEGPVIRPWNARELVLKDPDGYVLTLSMRAEHEKTFHDVIDEVTG
ncbi:VOC family protein [Bacillus nakamurai]|uniref:VOC family protein n=1 Tax=Bacillus nakamurai TaxID=1793963 RepID=UPI001E461488|nr:VOC family protein [Bacillus nakamurai]MCC9022148.1 VOC family protein [Bacillus nakamurai]